MFAAVFHVPTQPKMASYRITLMFECCRTTGLGHYPRRMLVLLADPLHLALTFNKIGGDMQV